MKIWCNTLNIKQKSGRAKKERKVEGVHLVPWVKSAGGGPWGLHRTHKGQKGSRKQWFLVHKEASKAKVAGESGKGSHTW